jgi:hypothetical protein
VREDGRDGGRVGGRAKFKSAMKNVSAAAGSADVLNRPSNTARSA